MSQLQKERGGARRTQRQLGALPPGREAKIVAMGGGESYLAVQKKLGRVRGGSCQ